MDGAARTGGLAWRAVLWGGLAALLALPAVAMRLRVEGVDWSGSDFAVMGALFAIVGGMIELGVRLSRSWSYRAGFALAVLASFLLVWVNLAVGFLGSEDNPANLVFLGVIALAWGGAAIGRFRAAGMARALLAAAIAQASAGAAGFAAGWASPGWDGVYEVAMGTSLFGGLWLGSAMLFRKAAADAAAGVTRPAGR